MLFYDFEVTKYDWLVVFIDSVAHSEQIVVNDPAALRAIYEANKNNIWVGFNNKHYDQYIFKGILLGFNPKKINDFIIVEGKEGWQFSRAFRDIPMINYDVMPNPPVGLKTLEGFMGSNIKETDVPFDIDRKLTPAELEQMIYYCRHDVEETIKVFMADIDVFNAMYGIVTAFDLPLSCIGDSEARITSKVLGCVLTERNDEFDFEFESCLRISKYSEVVDWFKSQVGNPKKLPPAVFYKQSFIIEVAGIPHTFGFGGLHGAPGIIKEKFDNEKRAVVKFIESTPAFYEGALYHVDVNNYYPSYLLAHGKVTRSATNDNYALVYKTRKELKYKQTHAASKAESKKFKKAQLPYKKLLNALSGAMKDKTNPAYDPRNNNSMCINGQLMLLDLIEHLEVIPGFVLIQSNTDGLIVKIPDTDEAFEMLDDICWEWEERCSTPACDIRLELECLSKIWQKDVNNYLWIDAEGEVERKGAYVKSLSPLDYDLPIINEALVNFMVKNVPISTTINGCNDLIRFQKVVKLSNKYHHVEHENLAAGRNKVYDYKCYRVFASLDRSDGRILKCRSGSSPAKFGNTPDHCFIFNDDVSGVPVPAKLDRQWYIDLAKKRLNDFGIGG